MSEKPYKVIHCHIFNPAKSIFISIVILEEKQFYKLLLQTLVNLLIFTKVNGNGMVNI